MPFAAGSRLPGESASKLGHLSVIGSAWVKALVAEFDLASPVTKDPGATPWNYFTLGDTLPLRDVWAVDGSFVSIVSEGRPPREVAFVKTALLALDRLKLEAIDREHPHPLLLQDVMRGSGLFHATVLPLKNIRTRLGSNYDAVRHIVRDSIKIDENGAFYETLKWLSYQKWPKTPVRSSAFECPHCHFKLEEGFAVDADDGTCPECSGELFLTDMLGFHLDMDEESAPESVSSAYMLIMEHLMLLTAVRALWGHTDRHLFSNTLFIKDGPLTLRGQYSKLVPSIRAFIQHTRDEGRPVHIIGQEKSGAFFDHLASISRFTTPHVTGEPMAFACLTHEFVRREVHRSPDRTNPYGMRTNWGEKLYVKLDPGCHVVLNVPTGAYDTAPAFPIHSDLLGLERILATLPSLVSHKFEGALFPVELANGIASMSSYPSAKILERFFQGNAR